MKKQMKQLTLKFTIVMSILVATYIVLSSMNTKVGYSVYANAGGSPGGKTNSPGDGANCTQCHSGTINPPSLASATIASSGLANGYIPGQTYTINATITGTSSSKIGFEITAEDIANNKSGTLILTDASRTILVNSGNAVTHNGAAGTAAVSGANTWTFDWTAPAAGTGDITFYGAFNATNSNFTTSGDEIYTTNFTVNESSPTSISNLTNTPIHLYPNPVKNQLYITDVNTKYNLIEVRNLTGKLVSSRYINGCQTVINLAGAPAGVYLVHLKGENNSLRTEKIIKQ